VGSVCRPKQQLLPTDRRIAAVTGHLAGLFGVVVLSPDLLIFSPRSVGKLSPKSSPARYFRPSFCEKSGLVAGSQWI
jgi:hypothetical protein